MLKGIDLYTNEAIAAFFHKADGVIDNDYFYHGLHYWDLLENVDQAVKGVTLNKEKLRNLEAILPPIPEQKKIASILTSVDNSIEKQQEQISKLQDLKKAMMQELLTKGIGHIEFKDSLVGVIPKGWEVIELGAVAVKRYGIVDGPFGSNLKSEHYRDCGIPVIQSGIVTSGKFLVKKHIYVDEEKYQEQIRSSVSAKDIVMAKIGANAGACAIMPDNHQTGILAGNSLKITVNETKASNSFITYILHNYRRTGELDRIKTETAQPAISISSLRKLRVPHPPLLEQKRIVCILTSLDINIDTKQQKLGHSKSLKKALMQDLLTGKVRVKLD